MTLPRSASTAPRKLSPAHEVVLHLDTMTYGGEALGRLEGKAVFVAGGLPGETVRALIEDDRSRFARARIVEIIEPAPDRVTSPCPHFGFDTQACGGCQWQHIDYAAQLRFKTAIVREQLQRIGHIPNPPVRDIIPSPALWQYRNHAQFHVAADGRLGFQAARSHHVVPIDECHIITPPVQGWLRRQHRYDAGHAGRITVRCDGRQPPISNMPSLFRIKDAEFQVSPESFFQVNTALIETLVDQALEKLEVREADTILDAYCGVGLFSRFLAPQVKRVIGIESSASAAADWRSNLAAFENAAVQFGRVEEALPAIVSPLAAAIFDPPRAGCGPQVIQAAVAQQIDRVVIVSCDPATLARDARQLIASGYALIDVQPLDMFPHTHHVETVTLFRRAIL